MLSCARKSRIPKAAAALAVLALALTGCGGSSPVASDGTVTLRFSWWGSDVRHKMTEKLIAAFEAENPNIKIKGEYGDWSGYWDKLATQVPRRMPRTSSRWTPSISANTLNAGPCWN
jgi:multiple sugar transport system substrate-binding protein